MDIMFSHSGPYGASYAFVSRDTMARNYCVDSNQI